MNFKNLVAYCQWFNTCFDSLWQKSESKWEIKSDTTFYPVYDFTKNIVVGDEGTVDLLIGAGLYTKKELSAKGRAKIQDSDVSLRE